MEKVKVRGSRLYQWELGRTIEITPPDNSVVSKVEFSQATDTEALCVLPREENGVIVAGIPNILLQSGSPVFVYLVYTEENLLETTASYVLPVVKRPKPADYVYTETEVMTWETLKAEMAKAVKSVNGVAPDESGNVEIPEGAGEWKTVCDMTVEEEVAYFVFSDLEDRTPLSDIDISEVFAYVYALPNSEKSTSSNMSLAVAGNDWNAMAKSNAGVVASGYRRFKFRFSLIGTTSQSFVQQSTNTMMNNSSCYDTDNVAGNDVTMIGVISPVNMGVGSIVKIFVR